jgi:hypothetical protein
MSHKNKLAALFLGCLQYGAPTSDDDKEEDMIRRYKFQNIGDDTKLRSCVDLLEDTENAIINFCEYQLNTDFVNDDLGERYLRLYGILNAVYLQIHAIIEIAEIVKYPFKKKIFNALSNHKIFELRNIAASHMVNYKSGKSRTFISPPNRLNYFRLTQCNFKPDGSLLAMVDGFGNYEEYNLKELVYNYNTCSEKWLIKLVEKYSTSLFKMNPRLQQTYREEINILKKKLYNYKRHDRRKKYETKFDRETKKLVAEINAASERAKKNRFPESDKNQER